MRIEIRIPGGIAGDLGDLEVAFRSLRVFYNASSWGLLCFSSRRKQDILDCVVALEVMCYRQSPLHAAGPRLDVVAALSRRKLDMPRIERVLEDASNELEELFEAEFFACNGSGSIRKDGTSLPLHSIVNLRLRRIGTAYVSVAYLQQICGKMRSLASLPDPLAA